MRRNAANIERGMPRQSVRAAPFARLRTLPAIGIDFVYRLSKRTQALRRPFYCPSSLRHSLAANWPTPASFPSPWLRTSYEKRLSVMPDDAACDGVEGSAHHATEKR